MNRLAIIALLVWPPAYCGGERYPLKREDAKADLLAEIEELRKELESAKAEVTAEDAKHKRTDVKKILGDESDLQSADSVEDNQSATVDKTATDGMDMVVTCVTVDGVQQKMTCDVPNCHEVAHNVWFSVDTGILFKRCDKHKDGVVVK